ncbi:MAG: hypothetical protein ACJ74Z_18595 [Bryobacteraceae bacterium]
MDLVWWSEHPSELPLLLLTAVVTHLLISFSQTLMHYGLGHRRLGGILFRNHIHYHHVHYSKGHLVSLVHTKNDGNNTPFFLIPIALMIASTYFIFPIGVFTVQIITATASFAAHVYLDKQYHTAGSLLLRFAWFRRKQQLHFVHHTHGNSNFAIIDNFWDRLLGTYRNPDADDAENPHQMAASDGQTNKKLMPGQASRGVI